MKYLLKWINFIPWIIILVVGYGAIANFTRSIVPNSHFMEITMKIVNDTRTGVSPILVVERFINQEFVAEWTVTVREVGDAGLSVVCVGRGRAHYSPKTLLPNPVSLDWWIGHNKCQLRPGRYRIDTSWEIIGETNRVLRSNSNIFQVYDHI